MSASQINEPLSPGLTRVWSIDEVIFETRTEFQHLVVARTAQGVSLFCDNDRQSTEFSQLVYHEALLIPALLLADHLRRVLIVGSSEGVASQLCVAAGATLIDHVDIDADAVRQCAKYLPYGYSEKELRAAEAGEGPVRVHYTDGWEFVRQVATSPASEPRYDLVLVDLPDERSEDPTAQHNRLYGTEFLTMCRAACTHGGVVAGQAGCPTLWRNETLIRSWQRFAEVFGTVSCFSSEEHEWAFIAGRADRIPEPTEQMVRRLETLPYHPSTLDAEALHSRTVLPFHVRRAL